MITHDELFKQMNTEALLKMSRYAGGHDEQMKGLFQKRQMLELVTNNQEVINILGKPLLKKVLGFVKAI